jgi:hypothetical protein
MLFKGSKAGHGNVRPTGNLRPAKHLNVARKLHMKLPTPWSEVTIKRADWQNMFAITAVQYNLVVVNMYSFVLFKTSSVVIEFDSIV